MEQFRLTQTSQALAELSCPKFPALHSLTLAHCQMCSTCVMNRMQFSDYALPHSLFRSGSSCFNKPVSLVFVNKLAESYLLIGMDVEMSWSHWETPLFQNSKSLNSPTANPVCRLHLKVTCRMQVLQHEVVTVTNPCSFYFWDYGCHQHCKIICPYSCWLENASQAALLWNGKKW